MGYGLGIDFGTTHVAAAVSRGGRAEIVDLGDRSAVVPTVVWAASDGSVLIGEAAERRGVREPERIAREFKRRFGDSMPLLLGGMPYAADALAAKVLAWALRNVAAREGAPPERIVVTHPANWGPYKLELLDQAITRAELGSAEVLSEPHAAALFYASTERVRLGATVLVYDLGGGTFDVAVLRKATHGFELLGKPEGLEHLGGMDFDEAVFGHVQTALHDHLDLNDPEAALLIARLRDDCVTAKEALSADTEVTIPVLLPTFHTEVRLVRDEFETMIRPALEETVAAVWRALRSAQQAPHEVDVVLLVGGSSRIPSVARYVSAELGRPVAVDAHPKHAVALGAAIAAGAPPAARPPVQRRPPDEVPPPAGGRHGATSVVRGIDVIPQGRGAPRPVPGGDQGSAEGPEPPTLLQPPTHPVSAGSARRPGPPASRRSTRVLLAVAVLVIVTSVAILVVAVDRFMIATPGRSPSTSASSPGASPAPVSPAEAAVRRYYAIAPADPAAAWGLLTPGIQASTGGLAEFRRFWSTIATVEVVDVVVVGPLTVRATLVLAQRGRPSVSERHELGFVSRDGTLLLDSDRLVRAES